MYKIRCFVIFASLVKFSLCVTPNPNEAISLDDLLGDVFKPVDDFDVVPSTIPEYTTQRPRPTVGPVKPPSIGCPTGVCTPKYLCNDGQINSDGRGILDLKFANRNSGPQSFEQSCFDYWDTCCTSSNVIQEPVVKPANSISECGYRNKNGISFRYVNGQNHSEYGEFPWTVAIVREDVDIRIPIFLAGGSIINPSVILTAAHYVHRRIGEENKIIVRAGEWDTQTTNELIPHQERRVKKIILHERFNEHNLHNDIALLVLESPFELNDVIQPICLPPQNQVFDYSRCVASGWGKNVFGKSGKYSVIMKKVNLSVVPRQSCQTMLRETRLGRFFTVDDSFICATGELGSDTCTGDGGSPLVCPIQHDVKDRYYQAGIVAWGVGCGDSIPAGYTNVALFRPWIDQQMEAHYLQTYYYETALKLRFW